MFRGKCGALLRPMFALKSDNYNFFVTNPLENGVLAESTPCYSARNASTGLTDAARRAGTKQATPDIQISRAVTPT
jgi:hypothetical protein